MKHAHDWHPTGTHYLTNPPIYHHHCLDCGAYGAAIKGRTPARLRPEIASNEPGHHDEYCLGCQKLASN